MTFRQVSIRALVCCVVLTLLPVGALAQTDRGTPETTMMAPALDLAAMTLTPFDLYSADLPGFGYDASSVRDFETEIATSQANLTGDELEEFKAAYAATGFQRRASSTMFRPALPLEVDESGGSQADLQVITSVTEYATAHGAAAGFELVEDESVDPRSTDLADVQVFGDQTEITKTDYEPSGPDEPAIHALNLTFRLGRLTADVIVFDYTGTEVDIHIVERLGEYLRRRIVEVQEEGAPGLSNQVLRLTPTVSQINNGLLRDRYLNIGLSSPPTYDDVVAALDGGKTWEEAIQERDVRGDSDDPLRDQPAKYQYFAYFRDNDSTEFPTPQEFESLGYVYVMLYQETSHSQAMTAYTGLLDSFDAGGGTGQYALDEDFPKFGDESFASFVVQDDRRSYAAVTRVGSRIAYIFFDVPDGPEVAPVAEVMMQAQLACLATPSERCTPMEIPDNLMPPERPVLNPPGGR